MVKCIISSVSSETGNLKASASACKENVTLPVDTRRRFNVYKTSIRRQRCRIDVV